MGKIERFEDIDAWKKARELTKIIYEVTAQGKLATDFSLRDQLRRAAVSIMANIAEGFEREGNKEFRQFLATAKGSAGEVKALLYVALDAGLTSIRTISTDQGSGRRGLPIARWLSAISENL